MRLPLLYVIDEEFAREFMSAYDGTEKTFDECHVITRDDVLAGTRTQLQWSQCVEAAARAIRIYDGPLALVLGHKGIFRNVLPTRDRYTAEARVVSSEAELVQRLVAPAQSVHVSGFHHVPDSPICRLISKPRVFESPGGFARLRVLAEAGGGPLGRLSALRHDLMRPFASARLRLQLDEESGARGIDRGVVERVGVAIAQGRSQLAGIESGYYDDSSVFVDAVNNAKSVLEENLDEITADPAAFSQWVDRLTDALDAVRAEAR